MLIIAPNSSLLMWDKQGGRVVLSLNLVNWAPIWAHFVTFNSMGTYFCWG